MPGKNPPKAATGERDELRHYSWKRLGKKPGVRILDVARREPR